MLPCISSQIFVNRHHHSLSRLNVVYVSAAAGFSGGGVSPARVLGPAIVFHCHWNFAWAMYIPISVLSGAIYWRFLYSSMQLMWHHCTLVLSAVSPQHSEYFSSDSSSLLQGFR